jgi:hypothetical protein
MSQVAHVCLGLAIVDLARETQRSGGRHFFPNELSSGQTQGSFTEFANFVVIHFNSAMPNRNLSADELTPGENQSKVQFGLQTSNTRRASGNIWPV